MDLLSGLKLRDSEAHPEQKEVSYTPFALLLKSYGGYELIKYNKARGECSSIGTRAHVKNEDVLERQVSMLYLRRDD